MQTTRWIDSEMNSIEDAIKRMETVIISDSNEESATKYLNWESHKVFETNKIVNIRENEIEFNCVSFSYNKVIPGEQLAEGMQHKYNGMVILYSDGLHVNYIIDKYTNALFILRKLLGYVGKKEIERNEYMISSDLFLWMIKKVYEEDNNIEQEDGASLSIDAVSGFRGDSEDLKTTVTANGESLMNLISTLSFVLESKRINQIKISLQYCEHENIEAVMNIKPSIDIKDNKYLGIYLNDEDKDINLLRAKLYLLMYLDIIPRILQAYYTEKENDLWNSQVKNDFFKELGEKLTNKITERIEEE
ncbi:MAG: hypothetical protein EGP96_12155 [Roseburia inulinivorans]|nr:hypothetical protein [Roseburia inulinivorans]